jgi:hypothetical protein
MQLARTSCARRAPQPPFPSRSRPLDPAMASAPAQVSPASALVAAPPGCSFSDRKLVLGGTQLPFVRYERDGKDEIWFPAKPRMRVTGETNITQCLERVVDECKMSFKELVAAKGLPQSGASGGCCRRVSVRASSAGCCRRCSLTRVEGLERGEKKWFSA